MKKIILSSLAIYSSISCAQFVRTEVLPNDYVTEPAALRPQKIEIAPSTYVTGYGEFGPVIPGQPQYDQQSQQNQPNQQQGSQIQGTRNNPDGSSTIYFQNNGNSRNGNTYVNRTINRVSPQQQFYNDVVGGSPYQMPSANQYVSNPAPRPVTRSAKQIQLDQDLAQINAIERQMVEEMRNGIDTTNTRLLLKNARDKFNKDLTSIAN